MFRRRTSVSSSITKRGIFNKGCVCSKHSKPVKPSKHFKSQEKLKHGHVLVESDLWKCMSSEPLSCNLNITPVSYSFVTVHGFFTLFLNLRLSGQCECLIKSVKCFTSFSVGISFSWGEFFASKHKKGNIIVFFRPGKLIM